MEDIIASEKNVTEKAGRAGPKENDCIASCEARIKHV